MKRFLLMYSTSFFLGIHHAFQNGSPSASGSYSSRQYVSWSNRSAPADPVLPATRLFDTVRIVVFLVRSSTALRSRDRSLLRSATLPMFRLPRVWPSSFT